MVWGGLGGLIPDLDVMINPFVDELTGMVAHRAFSHSIFFALAIAPVLKWISDKVHRKKKASGRAWLIMFFLAVFTHPLLDSFTVYGTQLLNPISHHRFAWNGVFIIDPVYTVPLLLGLIAILIVPRIRRLKFNVMWVLLGLTTGYLLFNTFIVQPGVINKAKASVETEGFVAHRVFPSPMPVGLLWHVVVETDEHIMYTFYRIGQDEPLQWRKLKKNHHLLDGHQEDDDVETLKWFSDGYYTISEIDNELQFNDLRFPRSSDFGMPDSGFIFSFKLEEVDGELEARRNSFLRKRPSRIELFKLVFNFMKENY